ncbi:MAG: M14 family metallopeptidase [Fimbriimonas sp.]
MIAALLIVPAFLAPPLDFYADGPYDSAVPRPESVLGYPIGSRITTYRDQERVVLGIADRARARVRAVEYGKSVEGRPLRIFAISSAENMKRLDAIRADLARLAEGDATPERLARTPAVVWINECIHGNEPASFESAMPLLYNLAASKGKSIEGMLNEVVVVVNPVYNPDGHERFAVWYNSIAVGAATPQAYEQSEPGVIHGRSNHYRFDMNRDRISFSQDETRQEVAEFLKWNPQVYVDQHGQVDTYFFPPNPMSVNANVDRARLNKWTEVIGRTTAKAFDARGYLYYIKDQFDLYYPGYLDSHVSLAGAIGMTHETDGGKQLAKLRNDGTVLTFRQGIDKHFTAALAVIRATAENRKELVGSYASYKKKWMTGEAAGKFRRVVLTSDDPRPLQRLKAQLARTGVRASYATKAFTQGDAHDYWSDKVGSQAFPAGSLIVDIAQSQGPIAKSLLEPGSDFEPEFLKSQREKKLTAPEGEEYPGPEGHEFYDLTGWSLPYAHNLKAWWCESAPVVETATEIAVASQRVPMPSPVGYAMRYTDQEDALAAMEALQAGVRGLATNRPMRVGNVSLPRGSFLFLAERNEEGWDEKLRKAAAARGATLVALPSAYPEEGRVGPGSDYSRALRAPKVGVAFGATGSLAQAGATWYLFDREFRLPFTPLSDNALNGDLSDYTAIIVPYGARATASGKLREWVQAGGNLIVLENMGWAVGSSGFVELEAQKEETPSLPGSLFRAALDPRSALSYGYAAPAEGKIELAVPIAGDSFYRTRKQGGSVVTISPDPKSQLLSGWTFGEDSEKALAGTVWLQDVPVGQGHAILFTQDPTARAMWPGLNKMLLNAILFGG